MQVDGTIVKGHRVASGEGGDPRFPGGTLSMQLPFFAERGLDLSGYHLATINVSISPLDFQIVEADYTFREVRWHEVEPAEDFSFVSCRLRLEGAQGEWGDGFIYYPHPETKPEHFQGPGVMEVILKTFLDGVSYGQRVLIEVSGEQIRFETGHYKVRD